MSEDRYEPIGESLSRHAIESNAKGDLDEMNRCLNLLAQGGYMAEYQIAVMKIMDAVPASLPSPDRPRS